jgi:arachidonate 15-lipoxygenase
LEPHLRFTRALNHVTHGLLTGEDRIFQRIYAGSLPESRAVLVEALRGRTFHSLALESDLEARGMGVAPLEYPYRDDARLWLEPLRRFTGASLRTFYADDVAVRRDPEIAAWLREIEDPEGGALEGLLPGGTLGLDALAELLALVLFLAGPGHAAVHFGQPDFHSVVEGWPAAAWAPPPRSLAEATPDLLARTLPPAEARARQFHNAHAAWFRFDRFGHYDDCRLGRVAALRPPVQRLHADLQQIEATVRERNAGRARPYPYLLPSRVPNSINL